MELFLLLLLFMSGYTRASRVFIVDNANDTIYYSDVMKGSLLTDLIYKRVEVRGQTSLPGSVTYDPVTNTVFWNEVGTRTIKCIRMGLPERQATRLFPNKKFSLSALAVDRPARKLVFVGGYSLRVTVSNLNGTNRMDVGRINRKEQVYAPNVDDINGLIYWSDVSNIAQSNLMSVGKTKIVEGLNNVTTLYFDPSDNFLYWIDKPGLVESYNVTSQERHSLFNLSSEFVRPTNITVHDGVLYWVDRGRGGIGSVGLQNPDQNRTVTFTTALLGEDGTSFQLSNAITDLKVFSVDEVDYCRSSPCPANMTCRVVSESSTYSCITPTNTANSTRPPDITNSTGPSNTATNTELPNTTGSTALLNVTVGTEPPPDSAGYVRTTTNGRLPIQTSQRISTSLNEPILSTKPRPPTTPEATPPGVSMTTPPEGTEALPTYSPEEIARAETISANGVLIGSSVGYLCASIVFIMCIVCTLRVSSQANPLRPTKSPKEKTQQPPSHIPRMYELVSIADHVQESLLGLRESQRSFLVHFTATLRAFCKPRNPHYCKPSLLIVLQLVMRGVIYRKLYYVYWQKMRP